MTPLTENDTPLFWHTIDQLVASSEIVIDRPKGGPHPRWPELIYPLDYGYLTGTNGGDGSGIDVWLGSGSHMQTVAIACTASGRQRDMEIKLLLGCNDDEVEIVSTFLNQTAGLPCVIVRRGDKV